MEIKKKNILFVCSAGGHLAQILELQEIINKFPYLIVTEDVKATKPLALKYNVKYLRPNTKGRSFAFWFNTFINFFDSFKILISFNPKLIITTGSHTAVPMCLLGKLLGKKVVWILSYARVTTKEKSANLIYPIADLFIVQWKTAEKLYPKAKYFGGIY